MKNPEDIFSQKNNHDMFEVMMHRILETDMTNPQSLIFFLF